MHGFGWLISNPVTGRILVLKNTGRKTGLARYTPVNYAIIDEGIYCYQGRHLKGAWYLNILANPLVDVIMPGSRLTGYAESVTDPDEAAFAIRQILKGAGLAGLIYGFNPSTVSEDVLRRSTEGIPVVKIKSALPNTLSAA
ncbi:MAG TPA: nitroreductase/quinone reductase family protein [Methanotrichaceae archaeon]|nr:nitroreductase/quinone reductase family protein [Methanotrichaceae archaeon]HQI90601.1 nitroreductase/quinone reductase family protein [Methanotrichaceae archaeon]